MFSSVFRIFPLLFEIFALSRHLNDNFHWIAEYNTLNIRIAFLFVPKKIRESQYNIKNS